MIATGSGHKESDINGRLVAVTGGAGYIGSVLVGHLLDAGYRVRVIDTLFWGSEGIADYLDRVDVVRADIRGLDPKHLAGVHAVVHLAGLSNDPMANFRPDANWEINAEGTETVIRAAKQAGVARFTFGSSASVYDGLGDGSVWDETADLTAEGPYAISKRHGEQAILAASDDTFCGVVLRQGTVYGFSPRLRLDLVVNTFVKTALLTNALEVHGTGDMWRPLIDVNDVARAHIAAIEAPADRVCGQVFNVLHDNYQIAQLATEVKRCLEDLDHAVKITHGPLPSRVRTYRLSGAKLRECTGFQSRVDVRAAVADLVARLHAMDQGSLTHPRFYNIEWMTILDSVSTQIADFGRVF